MTSVQKTADTPVDHDTPLRRTLRAPSTVIPAFVREEPLTAAVLGTGAALLTAGVAAKVPPLRDALLMTARVGAAAAGVGLVALAGLTAHDTAVNNTRQVADSNERTNMYMVGGVKTAAAGAVAAAGTMLAGTALGSNALLVGAGGFGLAAGIAAGGVWGAGAAIKSMRQDGLTPGNAAALGGASLLIPIGAYSGAGMATSSLGAELSQLGGAFSKLENRAGQATGVVAAAGLGLVAVATGRRMVESISQGRVDSALGYATATSVAAAASVGALSAANKTILTAVAATAGAIARNPLIVAGAATLALGTVGYVAHRNAQN